MTNPIWVCLSRQSVWALSSWRNSERRPARELQRLVAHGATEEIGERQKPCRAKAWLLIRGFLRFPPLLRVRMFLTSFVSRGKGSRTSKTCRTRSHRENRRKAKAKAWLLIRGFLRFSPLLRVRKVFDFLREPREGQPNVKGLSHTEPRRKSEKGKSQGMALSLSTEFLRCSV